MMAHRSSVLAVLALVLSLPLAAAAQTAPAPPGPTALSAATSAYFAALDEADVRAFGQRTAASFHYVMPDGARIEGADYFGGVAAHHLVASTPITHLRFGAVSSNGTAATVSVDVSSWDDLLQGARSWLERNTSSHVLTWTQAANGTWLLTEDHITSATHLI